MKITSTQLRKIIRETLDQHLRGNLDPQSGHMANLATSSSYPHYVMWAKTNGAHPGDSSVLADYALEQGLEADSLQVSEIAHELSLGSSASQDISNIMKQQQEKNGEKSYE
jgi:hypothetical protein